MNILGLHGGFSINQHDPAAALICDGKLIACVEEERLYRNKTARGVLPIESIKAVLNEAGLTIHDIDLIAHPGETYEDIEFRVSEYLIHHFGYAPPFRAINHQLAHMASAFYHSGYEKSLCVSYDAYGDKLSGSYGIGTPDGIKIKGTFDKDNSLGLFYATVTSFLGFQPGEDEYKVMGLAPYGLDPVDMTFFANPTAKGFQIDNSYIRQSPPPGSVFEQFYDEALVKRLGQPRRKGEPLTDLHRNIASGAQLALEKCAVSLISHLCEITNQTALCLAGGVALNCSANNTIRQLPCLDKFFVQPAASDRGLALGCALQVAHEEGEKIEPIHHVFYGPTHTEDEIIKALSITGFEGIKLSNPAETAAELIGEGCIVGWYQGRSEFGPRSLGHRSILADPSRANMKEEINARVKYREEFRPFAPSVLEEDSTTIFDMTDPSPYMTMAFNVRDGWGTKLPAITHVNNTARVQTVNSKVSPLYHELIAGVKKITGLPVVLNTSFNIKGQPIVEAPLEALSTFAGTGMDAIILGNYIVRKPKKPRS